MIKAFAYVRVSGKGQVKGDGFPRQLAAIKSYAAHAGISIIETFEERGVTGTSEGMDRPAWVEMIARVLENGTRTVVIEKLDRLARDLMIQEHIIADLTRRGITLISAAEPDLCSNDPTRKLMRQIMGAIAEYDKSMTVLKLRGARQRTKLKTGRCEGLKPYGEHPDKPEEKAVIRTMTALRASGETWEAIAAALNSRGVLARSGGTWHASPVRRIVLRATPRKQTTTAPLENSLEMAQIA